MIFISFRFFYSSLRLRTYQKIQQFNVEKNHHGFFLCSRVMALEKNLRNKAVYFLLPDTGLNFKDRVGILSSLKHTLFLIVS